MKKKMNNKGMSIIDIIFSVGIIVLVLTGVVILIVSTANVKRVVFERQKAIELSQKLIEVKIEDIKNKPLIFWNNATSLNNTTESGDAVYQILNPNFTGYLYNIKYRSCTNQVCNIIFTINWGVGQSLSVERFFSRKGI